MKSVKPMSRPRRHELAGAGSASSWPAAAWIQQMVAAGSLLALLLASGARAGEVSATQGPLDLGTRVNGVAGGRCQGGQCEVSGGTAAGANLFHRFNRFDTRGEIRGVSIQNGPYRTVVLGVLDPLGSFLNKGISLSSPAHLFFLSPGGLHVGAGAQFFNTPRLTLSTASSLGLGSGRFDVFRTTAAEAALLTGMPIRGKGGLSGDPAEAQRNGITSGGDLVVDGGLIQVDEELLLDAQGANLLLQAGSQLAAPGGSVELSGRNVTVAAGALVSTRAQAPAGPVPAPGTTTAPAEAPVVPAAAVVATTATTSPAAPALSAVAAAPAVPVALPSGAMTNSAANPDTPVLTTAEVNPGPTTAPAESLASTAAPATTAATTPATPVHTDAAANSASATSEAPALPVPESVAAPLPETNPPAPAQISAAGLDGGVIRISASSDAVVAGQLKALGIAATASGTTAASGSAASDQAGKGGRIEVTGQRVTLTAAALDASGPAGGGTVLLGGDVRGANPAVANASSTTVDAASTVRADALAKGDGGTVVAYASQRTEVAGLLSVRGGPDGGNGGFVETSGASVALSRAPDLAAPLGKGGTWLIDPYDIEISDGFGRTKTTQEVGLFSTGVNADGTLISNEALDPHWSFGVQGAQSFKTIPDGGWSADGDMSGWISDVQSNAVYASPPGTKLFKTSFELDAQPLAESSVAMKIWVDDNIDSFTINGKRIDFPSRPSFGEPGVELTLNPLDFKAGANSILVSIVNNYNFSNPTGLNPSGLKIKFSGEFKFNDQSISGSGILNSPIYHQPTSIPSRLSVATIQSALNAGGSVIVDTTNPLGAQSGNITVNSPIIKTAGGNASLTLNAHNNIVLNSNISSTSAALNLNLNADIDGNGSGATSLASGTSLNLNGGTATANGPISMAADSKIKDAQIVAPAINSDGGILENNLSLNVDSLRLNGGSLQANGTATVKALDLSGGSISGSGDLQVTQSFNRSGGTIDGDFSNLSITQVSGSLTPGALRAAGPVTLQAPSGQLTLDAPITASSVLARGSSGITLSGAAVLTASAPSGRVITLDAGSGAFLNNSTSGATALSKQPGATWAIYADNPTSTPRANLGGLAYNFKQYNQTFDTNQESNPILGSGNGLFFANSPTISVNLTSQVRKTYDGTNAARLVDSNYNITGVLSGDLVNINKPTRGTYDNKNASAGFFGGVYLGPFPGDFSARKVVSVSGLSIASATETATAVHVYGYLLGNSTASASIGTIEQSELLIVATSDSRVYNGTTRSDSSPEIVFGLRRGDTLTGLSQMFESKNVLGTDQSRLKVSEDYRLNDGNNGNNYHVFLLSAPGTITPLPLPVTGLVANNKVYDATSVAPLGGSAAVSPFNGDVVTLSGTAVGAFSDKNVGIDKAVTVTGVTIAGNDAGNYNLVPQTGLTAAIGKKDLPLTGLVANNKVYDATTVAPLGGSAAVSPFNGDDVSVGGTAVGAFADKNVAQTKAVSVSGLSLSGKDAGNYNLLPLTNLKAAITPAPLQISASSDSKIYDGTTQSSLAPKITQGGLWGDDRLTGLAQTYESKNALGAGQSKLIVSAYTLSDGNNGSNYVISFLPGLGTINRASVTPSFTVKSKPYDGNVAAEIAGDSLQGGLASDEVFMVGASALFDNAYAANDKLVTITGYTLSGQDADNYQLSSPTATSTASITTSITTQQDTDSSLPNDEPIKNEKANPTVGLQLSTLSSATASKSVDVDISNVVLLPPGASVLESTPSGSTQSQPTPTAASATSSVPNQSQPTASATAVTTGSATQEYQESDNRSAEDAKTSLGLSNAPSSEPISPARLQLVMQSAASFIRKYPVRTLNQ